jgi:hypothetical protein
VGFARDGLFTTRLLRVLSILDAQSQAVHALIHIRRDIEVEGHVPALIVSDLVAVDPERRAVINCAEVEQQVVPAPPLLGNLEGSRVPDDLVDALVVDSRKLGLVRERDVDAAFERQAVVPAELTPALRVVEGKLPLAVQVHPLCADELWAWVFGPGDVV